MTRAVTEAFARFTTAILATEGCHVESSSDVASGAVRILDKLSGHCGRLLGHAGTRAILDRSLAIARADFAWLGRIGADPDATAWTSFEASFAARDLADATEALCMVMATFIELAQRLIGKALVTRLLREVWPGVDLPATKEKETP